jgi:hypothetical protein
LSEWDRVQDRYLMFDISYIYCKKSDTPHFRMHFVNIFTI